MARRILKLKCDFYPKPKIKKSLKDPKCSMFQSKQWLSFQNFKFLLQNPFLILRHKAFQLTLYTKGQVEYLLQEKSLIDQHNQ